MGNGENTVRAKLTWRDAIYIISIVIAFGANMMILSNRYTLLQDQVSRNKNDLEKHNLDLIEYKLEQVDKKVDRILNLLGE